MILQARISALKGIKPHEWLLRFVFGGLVCVVAGEIAKSFGPVVGGLFLAFPAIFPASASLLESHEKQHKARAGFDGANRAKVVAAIDAMGTTLGCIGLASFAAVLCISLLRFSSAVALTLATLAWMFVSIGSWLLRKRRVFGI